MIGPGETALTVNAFEWFGTRVFSVVAGELIRSGKPPFTTFPCAFVWLLPWKRKKNQFVSFFFGIDILIVM